MAYSTIASGRLYAPGVEGEERIDKEAVMDAIETGSYDRPIASSDTGKVQVEDLFYNDGALEMHVPFAGWYVHLEIPLRPSSDFIQVLENINRSFDAATRESGYFLANRDVDFVDTLTPDGQGRVTVGREYANTDLKLIGVVEGTG